MDKPITVLIYTFVVACIAVLGLAFLMLVNDHDRAKVITQVCDGRGSCRTITVEFQNMMNVPADSLNAAAERIIHEVSK